MANGVKLASGYIELSVKYDGTLASIIKEIKDLEKSAQSAGDAIDKNVTKSADNAQKSIEKATKSTKDLGDEAKATTKQIDKAGKSADDLGKKIDNAGKSAGKVGDELGKGVEKAAKDAGKAVGDAMDKAAKDSGETWRDRITDGLRKAGKEAAEYGKELGREYGPAAGDAIGEEIGKRVGKAIHDSPVGQWINDTLDKVDPYIDGLGRLGDAARDFKDKNVGGAIRDVGDALKGIGQGDAATALDRIATKADEVQTNFLATKDAISGTTSSLMELTNNSGRISGALAAIGRAAGPIAIALEAEQQLESLSKKGNDSLFGGRPVLPEDGIPGTPMWLLNRINNGMGWDAFNPFNPGHGATLPPDPTKGFQSPIPSKPGVPVIPLPGQAPAAEPGFDVVPGSGGNPLAPMDGATAAPSGYRGDAALISGVPAGRYLQTQAADLTKGIADCSSAVEDLINMMDGVSTAGRQMATGNAPEWLAARGFRPTNQPMPGTFQVGFNPNHMQATLPGGTNFNWGSDAAAAARGVNGTGAWDPSFTQHWYRPVAFDDGGVLPPGLQLVNNGTGAPEVVLTPEQAQNAANGMPTKDAGPSYLPPGVGDSPGMNGPAALAALGGPDGDKSPMADLFGGKAQRTQGYIPAGARGQGTSGSSLFSGTMNLGAQFVNGVIEQAASAAATAVSMAATAGSFGAGGQAAGPAASFAIGLGAKAAERGVSYGFQMAGIAGDALAEILSPFGVPRLFQTDPSQFIPQLPGKPAGVTTGEKAQQQRDNPAAANDPALNPSGPVQPNQMPGQQVVGPSAPIATAGTGDFKPAPSPVAPALSGGAQNQAPGQNAGPMPKAGPSPIAAPPAPQPQQQPQKPPGPLDFIGMDMPGLFDDGGWLMPGQVGVNMSTRPEPILNADQWANVSKVASRGGEVMRPDPNQGATNDYSVNFGPQSVTVTDVNELKREIDSQARLQMMRYAGRP